MIRTFYWHDRIRSAMGFTLRRKLLNRPWNDFRHGNAGDIFGRNLITHFYPDQHIHLCKKDENSKLLTVGSIVHCARKNDVVFGSGSKFEEFISDPTLQPYLHSLRGPLTYEVLKKAGWDVSTVDHLADPGLLINEMVEKIDPIPNKVIFIPHYRERKETFFDMPHDIDYIDIDDKPENVAKKIMEAEMVYSSSLHGVIFAHSLGRPVMPVSPNSEEPLFKYKDYYLSMNLEMPAFLESIYHAKNAPKPLSPTTIPFKASQMVPPPKAILASRGIINS